MRYSKYFKNGQKIFLRARPPASASGRVDALTVYFCEEGPDYFDLALPYGARGEESFPFSAGMSFEILSDALGLGVRLTGTIREKLGEETIRLQVNNDLQIFQRRLADRLDSMIGLRYTKGQGTLRTFRQQWEKNIRILQSTKDYSQVPAFPKARVNLSRSGIRFQIKAPVEVADLCLLLMRLEPHNAPICTLAEVVWLDEEETGERRTAGMQFLNILEEDQKRIEKYLRKTVVTAAEAKDKKPD